MGTTILPEFLDACHNNLYSGFTLLSNMAWSAEDDLVDANNKLRPENSTYGKTSQHDRQHHLGPSYGT